MEYFSHDYNARLDEKVKQLLRKHKATGYGLLWFIIEDLYNNNNLMEADYEGLAYDYHENPEIVKSIICDFDLFVISGNTFSSKSVEKRLEERRKKSEKATKSAMARWSKPENELPLFEGPLYNPDDGVERNLTGLERSLDEHKIYGRDRNYIIHLSNGGEIGHPIWKVLSGMKNKTDIKIP